MVVSLPPRAPPRQVAPPPVVVRGWPGPATHLRHFPTWLAGGAGMLLLTVLIAVVFALRGEPLHNGKNLGRVAACGGPGGATPNG